LTAEALAERQSLRDADESITQFQRTMEEAAATGALDRDGLERFVHTVKETAARFNEQLLPPMEADAAKEISQRLIDILTLDPDRYEVLDAADEYLIELEAIRHVLRDLLQEQPAEALRPSGQEIIALLHEWLPTITAGDLADLLGVSVRQLQRRRKEGGAASSREQLVARLVAILRHAWTDAGVVAWFRRQRPELEGRTPNELLGDPSYERQLLVLARAGRVQGGS
jgi:uncharacterized protein (DUF2384 family)